MGYFEQSNSSQASELAYAKWYAQQTDERKAKMLCDIFQFGVMTIKHNAHKANPMLTEPELMLRYMEYNLKPSTTPDVFEFIRQKMLERAEEEWKARFRAMKKDLGWTYGDMAKFIGAKSGDSLKASVSRKLPGFAKLAVCVYEQAKQQKESGKAEKEG